MQWEYFHPGFEASKYIVDASWGGHKFFAYDLIRNLRPNRVVELGTHWGTSFFSFAQAVKDANLATELNAVDLWAGDKHTGFYENDVFETVSTVRSECFSNIRIHLLQMMFDDAVVDFADQSIDILHIDGLHTYDAVKHDFNTWVNKVSDDGIIIFHDINEKIIDFGVYKFWEELKKDYITFEFYHGHGLGILFKSRNNELIRMFTSFFHVWQQYYFEVYSNLLISIALQEQKTKELLAVNQIIEKKDNEILSFIQSLEQKNQEITELGRILEEKNQQVFGFIQSLEQKNQEITELGCILEEKNQQVSGFIQSLEQKKQEITELSYVLEEKSQQLFGFIQSLEQKNQENIDLSQSIQQKNIETLELHKSLNSVQINLDDKEIQIQGLRQLFEAQAEEQKSFQKTILAKDVLALSLNDQVTISKKQLEQVKSFWYTAEDEVQTLQSKLLQVESQFAEKQREAEQVWSELVFAKEQNTLLEQQMKEKEFALFSVLDENTNIKQEVSFVRSSRFWALRRYYLKLQFLLLTPDKFVRKYWWIFKNEIIKDAGVRYDYCVKYLMENGLIEMFKMLKRKVVSKVKMKRVESVISQDVYVARQLLDDVSVTKNEKRIDEKISVIIPTKNAGDEFIILMKTLRYQLGVKEVEIIVVDSGSSDETVEVARKYANKVVSIEPQNFSHSGARNLGAEAASGAYLLFMVQDAYPSSEWWLYDFLKKTKEADVVASSCGEFNKLSSSLYHQFIMASHFGKIGFDFDQKDVILEVASAEEFSTLSLHEKTKLASLNNVAAIIRADVFFQFKFRGNFAEDFDLGFRLVTSGYKVGVWGTLAVIHSHNRGPFYYLKRQYISLRTVREVLSIPSNSNFSYQNLIQEFRQLRGFLGDKVKQIESLSSPVAVSEICNIIFENKHKGFFVKPGKFTDTEFEKFFSFISISEPELFGKNDTEDHEKIQEYIYWTFNAFGEYLQENFDLVDKNGVLEVVCVLESIVACAIGQYLAEYSLQLGCDKDTIKNIEKQITHGV